MQNYDMNGIVLISFCSSCTRMTSSVGKSPLSFSDQLTRALEDDGCELPFCTDDNVDECLSYLNQVSFCYHLGKCKTPVAGMTSVKCHHLYVSTVFSVRTL